VAAEPPVNVDVSVAEPESDIGLEGKEERVNYGREPLSNVIPGEAEDARYQTFEDRLDRQRKTSRSSQWKHR